MKKEQCNIQKIKNKKLIINKLLFRRKSKQGFVFKEKILMFSSLFKRKFLFLNCGKNYIKKGIKKNTENRHYQ